MPITLVPQDNTGTVVGANTYATLAEFKSYHDERGTTYSAVDAVLQAALVKARDYVDTRFRYVSSPLVEGQVTEFPRTSGPFAQAVPVAVKRAQIEYALKISAGGGYVDQEASGDGALLMESVKAGPVTETKQYAGGRGSGPTLPVYPLADKYLQRAGLVLSGGSYSLG